MIRPPAGLSAVNFGAGVAVDEDQLVVADPYAAVDGFTSAGALHLYRWDPTRGQAGGWVYDVTLVAATPREHGLIGLTGLAVDGDQIAASTTDDTPLAGSAGRVITFSFLNGFWVEQDLAPPPDAGDLALGTSYGESLDLEDGLLVVGVPNANVKNRASSGTIVTHQFDGSWDVGSGITPPVFGPNLHIGTDVAIDAGDIAVGARGTTPAFQGGYLVTLNPTSHHYEFTSSTPVQPGSTYLDLGGQVGYEGGVWAFANQNGTGYPNSGITEDGQFALVGTGVPALALDQPLLRVTGDSYSSGQGAANASTTCGRAQGLSSWAQLLNAGESSGALAHPHRGAFDIHLDACSGYTIDDFWHRILPGSSTTGLGALSLQDDVVVLTLGGNSAHFRDILIACGVTDCDSLFAGTGVDAISVLIQSLYTDLHDTYVAIRHRAPWASIYVLGYPLIAPKPSERSLTCQPWFSDSELTWVRSRVTEMNGVIHDAASAAGVTYLSATGQFPSAGFCGSNPQINGLSSPLNHSYHPNERGNHSYALAAASSAFMNETPIDPTAPTPPVVGTPPVRVHVAEIVGATGTPCVGDGVWRRARCVARYTTDLVRSHSHWSIRLVPFPGLSQSVGADDAPTPTSIPTEGVVLASGTTGDDGSVDTTLELPPTVDEAPYAVVLETDDQADVTLDAFDVVAARTEISGTITEAGTSNPMAGARVAALRADDFSIAAGGVTDGAGNYDIALSPGTYFVYVIDTAGTHTSRFFGAPTRIALGAEELVDADQALAPTRGDIAGVVSEDGGGAVPGAWVIGLSPSTSQPASGTVADGTGHYALTNLAAGSTPVVFLDPAGGHATEFYDDSPRPDGSTPVAVTAGAVAAADAALSPHAPPGTGASLDGQVTEDLTGDAVPGVFVVALNAASLQFAAGAVADGTGRFHLAVDPGDYKLGVVDPTGRHDMDWYHDHAFDRVADADSVTAAAGVTVTTNVSVAPSTGTIAGIVTDDGTGEPLSGIWVLAIGANGVVGCATTGADGTYEIAGLRASDHRVAFVDPSGSRVLEYWDDSPDYAGAGPLTVTGGGTATASASLTRSP